MENHSAPFKPCVVIPVYNHPQTISEVVARIRSQSLPILIVNDGSNFETKEVLNDLESVNVRVVHLPTRRGKGAAVCRGFELAGSLGYSHALQVDADGQHDVGEIPHILARGRASPEALILGLPIFDQGAPRSRRWGRKITTFWIAIETLSRDIRDGLCGFRLYPIKPCLDLICRQSFSQGMPFDIEIAVRLHWRGVPVLGLPVRVTYPKNGVSHFRLFHDNIRISLLHARLFGGMILRIPVLITRKIKRRGHAPSHHAHWYSLTERGSKIGIRFLFWVYRILGRKVCSVLLLPIVGYFFATSRSTRRASRKFLRHFYPHVSVSLQFRHFMAFGHSALDRVSAWMGDIKREQVQWSNKAEFEALLAAKRGAVLLSAHWGTIDVVRAYSIGNPLVKINALMFRKHSPLFSEIVKEVSGASDFRIFPLEEVTPTSILELREKISQGEFVAMLADRLTKGAPDRVVHVPFLGQTAAFPEGPFLLAGMLRCPVYLIFCAPLDNKTFQVFFEWLAECIPLSQKGKPERSQHLERHVRQFASKLEFMCHKAPTQWFNFYDFWQTEPDRND